MLISLEGLDGSGKTTVWEVLREEYEFVFTAEPTDSWYGDAVRRSIGDEDADPLADLFLFTADHADHLTRVVQPALDRGEIVVSDRYVDSRYAYQSVAIEDRVPYPLEYVRGVHSPWTREPDLTIYLEVDPATGAARSGATDKLEQEAFLEQVAQNYDRLADADPGRYRRVDADQPPEAVVEDVEAIIEAEAPIEGPD
ncbi:MAG: dTMP kinase [Halobacteriaceae archaeon]